METRCPAHLCLARVMVSAHKAVCLVIQRPMERGNVPNVIPDPDEMLKLNLME